MPNFKRISTFLATAAGVATFVFLLTEPAMASLSDWLKTAMISDADNPANISAATGGEGSFRALARTIVDFFLYFLGLVSTIMIIYGGFLYITARGEEEQAQKGQKILTYAIIGIIVILISFALVNTIIGGAGTATEPTA